MLYLSQITAYSALLYAVYLFVLKNKASNNWNRMYLLMCAALPVIIPFIKIAGVRRSLPISPSVINISLPQVTIFSQRQAVTTQPINWSNIILISYLLVSAAILIVTLLQFISFRRFVRRNKNEMVDGVKVMIGTKAGPGSFGNCIFLPDKTIDPVIFEHELAHIKLKHSADVVFIRLMQIAFWPNAILYAIGRELKIVHEFQADAYAVKNKDAYVNTLLNGAFNTNRFALSHTFFYHALKRRIMMLRNDPMNSQKLRIAIMKTCSCAILLLAGVVYIQSCKQPDKPMADNIIFVFKPVADSNDCKVVAERCDLPKPVVYKRTTYDKWPPKDPSNIAEVPCESHDEKDLEAVSYCEYTFYHDTTMANGKVVVNKRKLYHLVKSLDKAPKPTIDIGKFLHDNLAYPEAALKKNIEGRVKVRLVVDYKGKIWPAEILESPDSSLSAEALRVIKKMPKWEPGKRDGEDVSVFYTLPILFVLGTNSETLNR